MSKIVWDQTGERFYETGVKKAVLYPQETGGLYPNGVAWNGLTAVTESPSGAEASPLYADDIKYLNLISAEEFGATIEAYTYPEEFAKCDGSENIVKGVSIGQQKRQAFGLSYCTVLGNDTDNNSYGYKLHMIYGALAAPSEKAYASINDSPEAITFSWELTTTPVQVSDDFEPTANITVDSTKVDKAKLAILEAILYGTDEFSNTKKYSENAVVMHENKLYQVKTGAMEAAGEWNAESWTEVSEAAGPRLPLPDEIVKIMK